MTRTKFAPSDRTRANDKAPGDYAGKEATVLRHLPKTSEYEVQFDDDTRDPGWLYSWRLDRLPSQSDTLAQLGKGPLLR